MLSFSFPFFQAIGGLQQDIARCATQLSAMCSDLLAELRQTKPQPTTNEDVTGKHPAAPFCGILFAS